MAALLSGDIPGRNFKKKDALVEHLEDCRRMGIEVVHPDVNSSDVEFAVAEGRMLGPHVYVPGPEGYDPEGILGTLPAIAQGLIGVAVGEYLLRKRDLKPLWIAGAAMLVAGIAWGFVFPVVKDIWSSTFVLVTCGISLLVLAALSLLFDGKPNTGARRVAETIVLPFGMNAIAAYTLHEVTWALLGWDLVQWPYRQLRPALGSELAAFAPVLLYLAFIWLAMFYLWRRRWLIRI